LRPDRSLRITTADELNRNGQITARTLPPHLTGQRLDLDYAVAVLMQQAA